MRETRGHSMRIRPATVVASCLLVLAGCTNPVGLSSSTLVPEQSALAYFQWVRSASAEARATELKTLRAQSQSQPLRNLKLALLLSTQADATSAQQAEALRLLGEAGRVVSLAVPEDYRILATNWLEVLMQREQLRQLQARQQETEDALERLREEHAVLEQSHGIQGETINSLQAQKALLEQQNKVMQKQIDALTAIEQQLVEQDQRSSRQP